MRTELPCRKNTLLNQYTFEIPPNDDDTAQEELRRRTQTCVVRSSIALEHVMMENYKQQPRQIDKTRSKLAHKFLGGFRAQRQK